jgi:hypothetical protein
MDLGSPSKAMKKENAIFRKVGKYLPIDILEEGRLKYIYINIAVRTSHLP